MVDPAALLDTLRPLRMPSPPDAAWPVLVMAAVGAALVLLSARAVALLRKGRRRVRRSAEAELALSRGLPPAEPLAAQARLLRRLVGTAAPADDPEPVGSGLLGAPWLERLDRTFATTFFSRGDGRAFGPALYRAEGYRAEGGADVEALDGSLAKLIAGMRR